MFSSRVPDTLQPNQLTLELERLRGAKVPIIDLTESNPTRVGIEYPPDLLDALSDPAGLVYVPRPFGLHVAREAVAEHLAGRGLVVPAERIVLAASTSEAYSLLFKLLCNPGDLVMVPHPSYPLFEHLTRLDGVSSIPYPLERHDRWRIDMDVVERQMSLPVRAVLLVNPNNPTGSYVACEELAALAALTSRTAMALVGDEVFAEYPLQEKEARPISVLDRAEGLTFALGGLSKSIGLPQAKLAWIAVGGPDALVATALERLEYICDAYLSVSAAVQHALPVLLRAGERVRRAISQRIRGNYARLRREAAVHPSCEVLEAEGGWYAVIRVPARRSEETLVLELLTADRVLVHPGYFYDFPQEAFLVASLLPEPKTFQAGVSRLLARASAD